MTVCAIICAAGKGTRAGFEKNKLLVPYDGIPVLTRTVQAFYFKGIDEIISHIGPTVEIVERIIPPIIN